jgi:cation/acetate symporter
MYNGLAAADGCRRLRSSARQGFCTCRVLPAPAYILGWTGAWFLAVLLAPHLRRFGQYTVPDFLGALRWPGAAHVVGALAAVAVSFVYLVVQIYGVG